MVDSTYKRMVDSTYNCNHLIRFLGSVRSQMFIARAISQSRTLRRSVMCRNRVPDLKPHAAPTERPVF